MAHPRFAAGLIRPTIPVPGIVRRALRRPSAVGLTATAVTLLLLCGPFGPAGSPGRPIAADAAVAPSAGRTSWVPADVVPTASTNVPAEPTTSAAPQPGATSSAPRFQLVAATDVGSLGIPELVLKAYHHAADVVKAEDRSCHLPWWLLAGIGHTESGHAESGRLYVDGTTRGRILGPVLNGSIAGDAVITDTDHGVLDGDTSYDRAVGPMQFIPSTWAGWGADGNGDGKKDPNNVFDATLAAGHYLCAGGRDLATSAGLAAAVLSYNNNASYLNTVLTWGRAYRTGAVATDGSLLPVVTDVTKVKPKPTESPYGTEPIADPSPTHRPGPRVPSTGPSGSASSSASSSASNSRPPLPCPTASATPTATPTSGSPTASTTASTDLRSSIAARISARLSARLSAGASSSGSAGSSGSGATSAVGADGSAAGPAAAGATTTGAASVPGASGSTGSACG
ncbi:lytic murein transglycosylase [Jatrophihabitans telluris]|uniref:Lytic murein transglycosylase n=1 Tax=Jatrophihabitans telluris TaxID=2038343 RepID=A0ABY4QWT7_9ACTN|nr:lytic murein transglycosylase [Jatrophihabitans telluris]UQX87823.1 lytic murein transglycosylase [Jatrophihabitans telluris]